MCSLSNELIDFLYNSPTAFHAVENIKKILKKEGFEELKESHRWQVNSGGKYFVDKNGSALVIFTVGEESVNFDGFKIVGAHTDSPGFRIKPNPEMISNSYIKLNTEVYGGPIINTWFDRPLAIAGRVCTKSDNPLKPNYHIVNINEPIAYIPNLAIHMNREINKGVELNKQVDTLPILGLITEEFEKDNYLLDIVSKQLSIKTEDILDFDLFLYEFEKGTTFGVENEFISSSRIDDLSMAFVGVKAMINSLNSGFKGTNVLALFDNEEVGSTTKQGADSPMLSNILERIIYSMGGNRENFFMNLANSFMISADGAHGIHPNRSEKNDPTNIPYINKGPVIKISANQRYTSDAESIAIFKNICNKANVPYQTFVNRSDMMGGSTIGPISSSQLPIKSVDIGAAMLAMHSIREVMGTKDIEYFENVITEFYKI